jgi:ABC-type transport system substrate-binding protein
MKLFNSVVLALFCIHVQGSSESATQACNAKHPPLDFYLIEGDAVGAAVEDNIRRDLERIGLRVNTVTVSKDDWNLAQTSGDFHLSFTESWGTPYDPHSYAAGWIDASGGEGHHQAFTNFESPASREELYDMVRAVLAEENHKERQVKWNDIHAYYHAQAVMLPLWGKRVPTLMNTRLSGYVPGQQQFDYPVHRLAVIEGSSTVTIAPGGQTGLFATVGRLDPHTYRPNEFFSNNWVYEGLLSYGVNGQLNPALAKSWTHEDVGDGERYIFQLRENVVFHDGSPWNCQAAKINFDHVLAGGLKTIDWHGWHGLPLYVESWECLAEMRFAVTNSIKYAPFLQELTYIRPLRMLSPASFVNTTDPYGANSCHVGWGTITHPDHVNVTCAGILNISGTGPFQFSSRESVTEGEDVFDNKVTFVRNPTYWDGAPDIETLVIKRYESSEAVKRALLSEELDIVWGSGVLSDKDIAEIEETEAFEELIMIFHSDDFQNVIMLLNSGKPPLDDINLRKTIIHAINKPAIIQDELAGMQVVVDNVFPLIAPYADVDLTPRWDYDFEKASLLSCDAITPEDSSDNNTLAVGLGLGLGIPCVLFTIAAFFFWKQNSDLQEILALKNKEAVSA